MTNNLAERIEAGEATNVEVCVALHYSKPNAPKWLREWPEYKQLFGSKIRLCCVNVDGTSGPNWLAPSVLTSLDTALSLLEQVLPGMGHAEFLRRVVMKYPAMKNEELPRLCVAEIVRAVEAKEG